ncbi:ABC transporter substrate-binding protein [Candidatus Formimonas warabiya]|uniref:ABC transporter substrate-binding protein n=1 Tax=Formimonas warabiya TaxID=1761012 RepID=A0A3G1L0R6_FORW1|nr:ABC transporter substrate-binding protein [Candidatus Formimonas warabiya]ATW28219.1 ABC transporter substrate-binding protein [Candidatus Formimonas warabiya]
MKRIVWLMSLIMVLAFAAVGCGTKTDEAASTGTGEEKSLKLGIIQIVEHPALDASRQGFLDVLGENGYKEGENLTVDYQNAQGDQSNLKTIATKFVTDQADMVLAIATPSAIAMASETTEIPILITAVTDPVAAKLVQSNEHPGGNVTGTNDMTPIKEQFDLLKKIVPDAKKVGVIYNSSEVNSQVQVEMAKGVAQDLGMEIVEATVTGSAEVMQVSQSLVGKVDAMYVPGDNVVASSIASVVSVAEKNKLPLIVSERGMVDGGALGTIGIDYYKLGRQTGEMALRVINGEKPAEMPIESLKDIDIVINQGAADRMGVTVPQEILDQAKEVIK